MKLYLLGWVGLACHATHVKVREQLYRVCSLRASLCGFWWWSLGWLVVCSSCLYLLNHLSRPFYRCFILYLFYLCGGHECYCERVGLEHNLLESFSPATSFRDQIQVIRLSHRAYLLSHLIGLLNFIYWPVSLYQMKPKLEWSYICWFMKILSKDNLNFF